MTTTSAANIATSAASIAESLSRATVWPRLPAAYTEARWYAAYTCANHEKRVAEKLARRSLEHFLPLYTSVRRWKDRRVMLELPLFPGYVFVRMALRDRLQVLQAPGVVRLVGFDGLPTPLGDEEVEALRNCMARGLRTEPHPYLNIGCRVRILGGPLLGHEGVLIRKRGNFRVVLSLDLIQRSIIVDVNRSDIGELPVEKRALTSAGYQSIRV